MNRFTTYVIFLILFSSIFAEENILGLSSSSFKQEIYIPIDTSKAKYYPIDIHVSFNHPCWAKNETLHSVRVCYDDGSGLTEIDSQIYDLEFIDDSHIKACNLVFLIPEEANGKEKYYVIYDDSETPPPNYPDHLTIEDTHYFYEPISGQKMDFDYYKITQDGYIIYGICQKGEILGEGVSHTIIKLKPNSTEFETKNADQFASFAMSYSIDGEKEYTGSARAETVDKSILVDGNLMVRVKIKSIYGSIETSNIYTYYYCPTSTKRIIVNTNHRVLDTVEIMGDKERDGTYASLSTFKSRSASIEKMNVGNILPSLHLYGEDNTIRQYSIPTNPNSPNPEWILSTYDDIDLGSKAWLCIDDPTTGKAHALIFQSNSNLLEKEDGIQVKASVKQVVKLPGLEADTGNLFATRNAYEKGKEHNLILPKGMNVTFNGEFVTTEKGGYEAIDKESEIFQKLIPYYPLTGGKESKVKEKKRYSLTVYVHLAPSFPFGSLLSAVSGKNFPYIYAELYRENLISSGSIGRLPLSGNVNLNLKNLTLIQKIKALLNLFDWRNATLFKKIYFPEVEEGRYLVKIYRENPLFGGERKFIGFGIVDVNKDSTLHIFCKPEGKLQANVLNQNGEGIKGVEFLLLEEGTVVAEAVTNDNGSTILKAPCSHSYTLQVVYQGFLVEKKEIRFGLLRRFLPLSFTFPLYRLKINVRDSWGLVPAVDLNPILTSKEMINPTPIKPESKGYGEYVFNNLYPADYILKMDYKSFVMEKEISVGKSIGKSIGKAKGKTKDTTKILYLIFPAEFAVDFKVLNSYGMKISNGRLLISREGKEIEEKIGKDGRGIAFLPPGLYGIKVIADGKEVARYPVDVRGDKEVCIVTSQNSLIHIIVLYLGIAIAVLSIVILIWKRKVELGTKILAVSFIIMAIVSPWWVLIGEKEDVEMVSKVFLYPPNIVTMFSTPSLSSGTIASVPDVFTMVLTLLSLLLIVSCILTILPLIKRWKISIALVISTASAVLLIITVVLFFYAMSQITSLGVGSFSGAGNINTNLPEGTVQIPCKWGGGTGFYLTILAIATIILVNVVKILTKRK